MFYWALFNIKPSERFKLENIQLLAVAPTFAIKKFGFNKLFSDFINSMNKFRQNNFHFDLTGQAYSVSLKLGYHTGDTPASGFIGGFKEGAMAHRFCRICEITELKINICFYESQVNIRKIDEHKERFNLIKDLKDLSITYGITEESILMKIDNFDVCKCLFLDTMHILYEGVCHKELKLLLNFLVKEENLLNLNDLNYYIQLFEYSYLDKKDLPNVIKTKEIDMTENVKFNQKAAQMAKLLLNLPFILGKLEKITQTDNWKNFICLTHIINISSAYQFDLNSIENLKNLIIIYLQKFRILYNENLTPKMHLLIHFPNQILQFGPLIQHSCMRFEQRHSITKRIQYKNFINIYKTIADTNQILMLCNSNRNNLQNEYKIKEFISNKSNPLLVQLNSHELTFLSYLKKDGFKYQIGCFIILDKTINTLSSFGHLNNIIMKEKKIF
jgi:hypothetical protein